MASMCRGTLHIAVHHTSIISSIKTIKWMVKAIIDESLDQIHATTSILSGAASSLD